MVFNITSFVLFLISFLLFSLYFFQGTADKKVTFAIHSGNNTDTHLGQEHLDKLFTKLKLIETKMKEVKLTESIITKKLDGHHECIK